MTPAFGLARVAVAAGAALVLSIPAAWPTAAQGTWGGVDDPCLSASGTPSAGSAAVAGVEVGTPTVGAAAATPADPAAVEIGLLFIDLTIPHDASIAAVAQAATSRVQDERLQEIARATVAAREAEIGELQALRQRFYPDQAPLAVDTVTMTAMDRATPGASIAMAESTVDQSVAKLLAAICTAEDADRAFIDLAIPHHRTAIDLARPAAANAEREEIRAAAERILGERQAEIDALAAIRQELYGSATPEPVGPVA